jgi:RNA polymerase sigma-H factor
VKEWEPLLNRLVSRLWGFWGPAFGPEDALQEGRLALLDALSSWDVTRSNGMELRTWVAGCVYKRLLSLCRDRPKAHFAREMVSLDDMVSVGLRPGATQEECRRGDLLEGSATYDPWTCLERRQRELTIWEDFALCLTPFELSVFRLWCEAGSGQKDTYLRIVEQLGCSKKQVDNAMSRVKRKMRSHEGLRDIAEELGRDA